jgi:D-2-hydroxyacid dehydrogenase (NADP+)
MKILVDLNSNVDYFSIKDEHKQRLVEEIPEHEFMFMDSYEELKKNIAEAEMALVWKFPVHLYKKAENLKALYTPAAGKDWLSLDPEERVQVFFSSFHGHLISESFLSMLFYVNTKLAISVENQRLKKWARTAPGKRRLLNGQSLLIIGCGAIGATCADKAKALGMNVAGVRRNIPTGNQDIEWFQFSELANIIGQYDHVLNLLPGGEETLKLVDGSLIKMMKKGAVFYNFGRGTTVDEEALVKALSKGNLGFAALDVTFDEPLSTVSPLWDLENVLITPHNSCCYDDYLHLFIDEVKKKLLKNDDCAEGEA